MIGENLNPNRCPQADYDGLPCWNCRVKCDPESFRDCEHNVVALREEKWWLKKDKIRIWAETGIWVK